MSHFHELSVTSPSSCQRRSRLWFSYFPAPQIDNPEHRCESVNLVPDHRFPVRLSSRIINSHARFHIASVAAHQNPRSPPVTLGNQSACQACHRSLVPYTTPNLPILKIPHFLQTMCTRLRFPEKDRIIALPRLSTQSQFRTQATSPKHLHGLEKSAGILNPASQKHSPELGAFLQICCVV